MPITYDPTTNTITVTGGTEDSPLTFEDIYNADVANGWGVFTKLSEGVYKTTAKLQFGDGVTETWFKEVGTMLIMDHIASANGDTVVVFSNLCHATFGEYTPTNGEYDVSNGVIFASYETVYTPIIVTHGDDSDVHYYNCYFMILNNSNQVDLMWSVKEIKGCISQWRFRSLLNTYIDYCILTGPYGWFYIGQPVYMTNLTVLTPLDTLAYILNKNVNFENCKFVVKTCLCNLYRLQQPNIIKFINCKANKWVIKWYLASGEISGEVHRVYTVTFKVTDVNGNPLPARTVKVYNKNGDKVAELITDENGLTPEGEILYAKLTNPYADGTWHTFTDEDWEYFNPFIVEVWYGNELEWKGILTNLDVESTFIQITVKPSSFTLDDIFAESEKIRKYLTNRWKIENNQLIIYDDDGVTPILKFNLYDKFGNPTEINVYERKPVE